MKNKPYLLILLCLCLLLAGCAARQSTAPTPVELTVSDTAVPPIDDTTLFSYEGQAPKTLLDFYKENPDTIGWLTIPGIKTDNVVMLGQTSKQYPVGANGQNHYLDYSFNHTARTAGELYMDHRCRVTYNSMSENMTIYGHHMRDGTMLAGIDSYKREAYYKEHPYFTFHTLWGPKYFKVFGVFTVNLKVPADAAFDYRQPTYGDGYDAFVSEVKQRSYYDTGVEVPTGTSMIALSTCTYPSGNPGYDNARLVVMGRLCTDPDEIAQAQEMTKQAS